MDAVDDAGVRETLYQELIMQRARAPLHAGVMEAADRAADGRNPFCGDEVHVTVALSGTGQVRRLLHRTRGCAICAASADLMADAVSGLDACAIRSLFARFDGMLQQGGPHGSLGLLDAFGNLHEYRSRIRCATLPWAALLDAVHQNGKAGDERSQ